MVAERGLAVNSKAVTHEAKRRRVQTEIAREVIESQCKVDGQ